MTEKKKTLVVSLIKIKNKLKDKLMMKKKLQMLMTQNMLQAIETPIERTFKPLNQRTSEARDNTWINRIMKLFKLMINGNREKTFLNS